MVMQPDAYGLISGQNPDERLKNRKMLLQPVPNLQRHVQAVQHRLNHVKQSHNFTFVFAVMFSSRPYLAGNL
jgi:hypothetical protein